MGILDNIIGRSPFLNQTQSMFGQPQQNQMPQVPQAAPPQFIAPQAAPKSPPQAQGGQQGGGPDLGMIMKIMSMFGGV